MVISSYSNFYCEKDGTFLPNGEVKISVLPPFQTKRLNKQSVNVLSRYLQEKMQNELERLNKMVNLKEKNLSIKKDEKAKSAKSIAAGLYSYLNDDENISVKSYRKKKRD